MYSAVDEALRDIEETVMGEYCGEDSETETD